MLANSNVAREEIGWELEWLEFSKEKRLDVLHHEEDVIRSTASDA